MRAKVFSVISVLGALLLLTYTLVLRSPGFTRNEKHEDDRVNFSKPLEKEEGQHPQQEKEVVYPHPTRCSMWNTQPPPARWPRWISQNSSPCPRYAYVPFNPWGGFGHKMDNFMNGLILSSALNFTYMMTPDFEVSKKHASPRGAVRKLGLGTYSPHPSKTPTNNKDICSFRSSKDYEHFILKLEAESVAACNTTYTSCEYYTDDRSPVRWHMAHMVQNSLSKTRLVKTVYDHDKFNIAVHLRYGSFSKIKGDEHIESYVSNSAEIIRMVRYFTTELEQIGVPYAIHFFTGGDVKEDIVSAFPGAAVYGKDMSIVNTVQHFIESDLLFCLVSSMCRAASIMSTRPLVVNGYPTAEGFFYNPCPRGLFCDLLNRTNGATLSLRRKIREAGERWLVSHRLSCPTETEAWPDEDKSIAVSSTEQCDIWGPPPSPRMLFDPSPNPACPRYGYIPLDERRSGSFDNILRWIKGVALSNLMNATFVFGGNPGLLSEEADLGLTDELVNLHTIDKETLAVVDVPLSGVKTFGKALEQLESASKGCMTVYKFGNPQINELGWTRLTLGHAVQKHIADTKWSPSLWTMDTFNFVVDMSGSDNTVKMDWVFQSLTSIFSMLNRKEKPNVLITVIAGEGLSSSIKAKFRKYGKTSFVPKPKSIAEHVKHLAAASDLVFCPKLDADECHIAALAGTRPGFIVRGEEDGFNFCPGADMCNLVLGDRPITEENTAFIRGISERWVVGKYTKCL